MTTSKRWVFTLAAAAAVTVSGCEMGDGAANGPDARPGLAAETPDGAPAGAGATPATRSARIVERDIEAPEVFSANDTALWDGRPSLGGVWVAHPTVKDPERVIIRNPANGKFVIGALFRRERDNPGPKLQVSSDAAAALDILAGAPTQLSVVALRREEKPDATPAPDAKAASAAEDITATALQAPPPGTPPKAGAQPAVPPAKPGKPGDAAAIAASAGAAIAAAGDKPAAPKPAAPKPASSGKSFVQIGIFSQEANAKRASDQLKKAGIASTIRTETAKGKTFWRVVAGPAGGAQDRAAMLQKIKGLGYPDAYAVSK